VAEIISFRDVMRARDRARQRELVAVCVRILEGNLEGALQCFAVAPMRDRPVRARQIRQLADLLEYVVNR